MSDDAPPPVLDGECRSCFQTGAKRWTVESRVSVALESLGYLPPLYCDSCVTCGVCGLRVEPGEGSPADWGRDTRYVHPAIHRACFASDHPVARECYARLRAALLGENVP
jgi:hypothetical protein